MNQNAVSNQKNEISYGYSRTIDAPYSEVVSRTREALRQAGFGVLCEIDLKEKLKEKLGVDFRNYVILGACNPPLAYQTLQEELPIGLLLPCNVVVYEQNNQSVVAAIDAERMMSVVGNPNLAAAAGTVNEKLRRVIDSV
jgi:uncharacterized protein (DUF302 family)